ncbi:MAG TPA: response regulator transcription factor [Chloroflexota bacterium]|nr:response regulator transcription factor [Chloroflexota bacterium]
MSRILVVDDEASITDFLRLGLEHDGYEVDTCASGLEAINRALRDPPDLMILDVMLPHLDGLEVCRRLRTTVRTSTVPILMLTAKDEVADRVEGLESGADDYLIKPFAYRELRARVRALLRRQEREPKEASVLTQHGVVLDLDSRDASRDGKPLQLTSREFDLLAFLVANAGRVLSRELIIERVWGHAFDGQSNVIDVHIHALRRKLGLPNLIQAVRGSGFVFRR